MAGSTEDFDLVVIGFGKAGKTVAMKRAKAGDRVALVERDPMMYGGTCINVGCVPTKTLLTDMARFELGVVTAQRRSRGRSSAAMLSSGR